jgi:hypothetical protein
VPRLPPVQPEERDHKFARLIECGWSAVWIDRHSDDLDSGSAVSNKHGQFDGLVSLQWRDSIDKERRG